MKVITQCVGALLACVTVAMSAHAAPVTIDFQALEVPGNPSPTIINFNYVEEGFRFTGPSANRFGTGSRFYAGSTAIRVGSLGGQLRGELTTVSGAPFDLVALDLAEGNNGLSNVIVTGTFVGGGHHQPNAVDPVPAGHQRCRRQLRHLRARRVSQLGERELYGGGQQRVSGGPARQPRRRRGQRGAGE